MGVLELYFRSGDRHHSYPGGVIARGRGATSVDCGKTDLNLGYSSGHEYFSGKLGSNRRTWKSCGHGLSASDINRRC